MTVDSTIDTGWTKHVSLQRHIQADARPKLLLLEHDDRFGVFSEYQFYDFNQPFKLPGTYPASQPFTPPPLTKNGYLAQLKGSVDHIICDPPFLSEDCQTKGKRNHEFPF